MLWKKGKLIRLKNFSLIHNIPPIRYTNRFKSHPVAMVLQSELNSIQMGLSWISLHMISTFFGVPIGRFHHTLQASGSTTQVKEVLQDSTGWHLTQKSETHPPNLFLVCIWSGSSAAVMHDAYKTLIVIEDIECHIKGFNPMVSKQNLLDVDPSFNPSAKNLYLKSFLCG